MNSNIALALAIAVIAMITTGLAGHLAATKPWHKWVFWGGGLLILLLIVIQTYKNEVAQQALQAQLDKIQKNTETPPQVHVEIPQPPAHTHVSFIEESGVLIPGAPMWPFHIGDAPVAGIGVHNVGGYYLHNAQLAVAFVLTPLPIRGNDLFDRFVAKAKFFKIADIPPNVPETINYVTQKGPKLSQDDIDALSLSVRKKGLMAMGRLEWQDDTGYYAADFCEYMQAEEGPKGYNWHSCDHSGAETKISQMH